MNLAQALKRKRDAEERTRRTSPSPVFTDDGATQAFLKPSEIARKTEIINDFIGLSDVPSSYTGQGGKFVRVKINETGLGFDTSEILSSIAITTPPTKTAYKAGETFSTACMVVTATYSDSTTAEVTSYNYSPSGALTTSDTTITVSYTEGGLTKTATQTITVASLNSIAVTTAPTKTTYTAGESFDPAGMVITATYSDASTATVTGYTYTPAGALATSDTSVTISYTEAGVNKTTTQAITVTSSTYTTNMVQFFATPGMTGKIRLKVEKPADADGVMIRWKSSAWVSGDTKDTGTLVETITDTSNYKDANEWYEATGLTDGTLYYFKAFPYKGTSYNQTIGSNETRCKAGGLELELSFDSISGTTIYDTSGNGRNCTMSGITYSAEVVGNGAVRSTTAPYIALPDNTVANLANKTICFFFNNTNTTAATRYIVHWSNNATTNGFIFIGLNSSGKLYIAKGAWLTAALDVTNNATHFVCLKHTGNAVKYNLDNGAYQTGTGGTAYDNATTYSPVRILTSRNDAGNFTGWIDQFRVYSRELEDYEVTNLYNGGAGC